MEYYSEDIKKLVDEASTICTKTIAPLAAQTDAKAVWPRKQVKALGKLLGLHVPKSSGGLGQGLIALTALSERIAQACSSTAMCFVMHSVGTAVITAKATDVQKNKYLSTIAKGKHITSLALSEPGTGAHFYFPQTKLKTSRGGFAVSGIKEFITNGVYADSYVISTQTSQAIEGEFNCLILDNKSSGMVWGSPWKGFGFRGNSSTSLTLKNVFIPKENLLGKEGDETYYVFQVIAPYFLIAIAGVYLGIAQRAFDLTVQHIKKRRYAHSGKTIADEPVIQDMLAAMWQKLQRCRSFMYRAALLGDTGNKQAVGAIAMARVDAADTAISITNDAMTLTGGKAYAANSDMSRLLRDARASSVMAPTPGILRKWIGRDLVGLPMLGD